MHPSGHNVASQKQECTPRCKFVTTTLLHHRHHWMHFVTPQPHHAEITPHFSVVFSLLCCGLPLNSSRICRSSPALPLRSRPGWWTQSASSSLGAMFLSFCCSFTSFTRFAVVFSCRHRGRCLPISSKHFCTRAFLHLHWNSRFSLSTFQCCYVPCTLQMDPVSSATLHPLGPSALVCCTAHTRAWALPIQSSLSFSGTSALVLGLWLSLPTLCLSPYLWCLLSLDLWSSLSPHPRSPLSPDMWSLLRPLTSYPLRGAPSSPLPDCPSPLSLFHWVRAPLLCPLGPLYPDCWGSLLPSNCGPRPLYLLLSLAALLPLVASIIYCVPAFDTWLRAR